LEASPASVPRRVWWATAWQVLGRVWGALCTFAILLLAEQRLDAAGFGRFTFYLAVFSWLDTFATLGTGALAVQRTAGHPERIRPVLAAARRVRVAAGACGVVLVGGGAHLFREPGALWLLIASVYPITHALELSITPLKNQIAWGLPVAIRSISSVLQLVSVAWLSRSQSSEPAAYLLAVALGSTSGNVLLHLAARRHLPPSRGEPPEPMLEFLRASLPLGLSAICAQTYFYIDNVFILAAEDATALGHYNVAVRFMSWTIMLATYVTYSALPWLTRRHLAGELGSAAERLGQPLLAVAGLGAGLVAPWSERLLAIFGPEFTDAGPSLRWLFAAAAVIYAGALFGTVVIASGNMLATLWWSAGGVALNAAGNAFAVPRYGIEGAAAMTFATELFVAVAAACVLVRSRVLRAGGRAYLWLGGPVGFAFGWWLSLALRDASGLG
jgi:O-antigen/teichoic acid export membrane protein